MIAAAAATAARAARSAAADDGQAAGGPAVEAPGAVDDRRHGDGDDEHADDAAPADHPDFLGRVEEMLRYATELLEVVDGADERFGDDFEEQRRQIEAETAKMLAAADDLEAQLLERADQARRAAELKARGAELERLLAAPRPDDARALPSSPAALLEALDQELKLAKGILGAQRIGELAALLVRGSHLVHRMREQATAGGERRIAEAAKARDDAEASQQNRLGRGLALVHHDLRVFLSELPPSTAAWDDPRWASWEPPDRPYRWLRYGTLRRPDLGDVAFPAVLPFPGDRGLSIDAGVRRDEAVAAVQAIVVRLLAALPPGYARFTFIDGTTLGEAVTPFLSLARYRPDLVDGGVHTVPEAIDAALVDLTRHIEQVVQQHLRGRYASLEEANRDTDDPVPHRFVVVFDHPNGLSDQALKLLKVVCETGPRCGVHPIVLTAPGPGAWGAKLTGLQTVKADREGYYLDVERAGRWRLELDAPPPLTLHAGEGPDGVFTKVLTAVGEGARRSRTPQLAPAAVCAAWSDEALLRLRPDRPDIVSSLDLDDPATWWSAPADRGVGGPLGVDGAGAPVGTWLDGEDATGLLFVGDDRAVVSDAVAAAVHGLALAHGPEELVLWLVGLRGRRTLRAEADAGLPHARLVAVDVDARVGLAALDAADTELDRRQLVLAALGSGDDPFAACRASTGVALERVVVVIDGIELLVGGRGETARRAAELIERLTADGPAVGIHLVAGLGAGRLDARRSRWLSTMLPTTVEVAAPVEVPGAPAAELSVVRPMRAAGPARRRRLREMRRRADAAGHDRRPQVERGDEPAQLRSDDLARLAAGGERRRDRRMPRLLLGASAALTGPCEVTLQRRPGQHVLLAGGDAVVRAGLEMAAVLSTLACHGDTAEVRIVDLAPPDVGFGEAAIELATHDAVTVARTAAVADLVRRTRRDTEKRLATRAYGEPPLLVVVHDAHALDDVSMADLTVVARTGAEVGVHLVAGVADLAVEPVAALAALMDHRVVVGGPPSATLALAVALDAGDDAATTTPPWAVAVDQDRARVTPFRPYGLPSVEVVGSLGAAARRGAGSSSGAAAVSLAG